MTKSAAVAADYGLSARTVRKRKYRYTVRDYGALADAGSSRTSEDKTQIHELRAARKTGDEIAPLLDLRRRTVFCALRKLGLSQLPSLEPKPPAQQYKQESPGICSVEIKRLGMIDGIGRLKARPRQISHRKPGRKYLHVYVDDASPLAYTAIHADTTAESVGEFLWCAAAWYKPHTI